jgi:hypothetical protein
MTNLISPFVRSTAAILIAGGLMTGCAGYTSNLMRPNDLSTKVAEQREPIDLNKFRFPGLPTDPETPDTLPLAYTEASGDPQKRNRLQDILIEHSDTTCTEFKDLMYARVAARKVGLQTTALLTAGAAAIVGGDTAQKILAGVGAAAVGFDAIVDAEVLQNQLITAVATQIDTSRTTIRTEIESKRKTTAGAPVAVSNYSIDQAIRDVNRYHTACGFLPAIQALVAKAETPRLTPESIDAQQQDLEAKLNELETKIGTARAAGATGQEAAYQRQFQLLSARLNALTLLAPIAK